LIHPTEEDYRNSPNPSYARPFLLQIEKQKAAAEAKAGAHH